MAQAPDVGDRNFCTSLQPRFAAMATVNHWLLCTTQFCRAVIYSHTENFYQHHFYDKPRTTHLKCVGTGKEEDNQQAGDKKEEAQRLCGGSEFPPALMVFFP